MHNLIAKKSYFSNEKSLSFCQQLENEKENTTWAKRSDFYTVKALFLLISI